VDEILSAVGRIDILVNNAGIAGAPGSTGTAYRDIDWELDVESEREGPL
jgi:NAD(P)-dependent dehydrogenase (short-subunit alcohol dehydrogenase family)